MSSSFLRAPVMLRSSLLARPARTRAFYLTARRSAMSENDHHKDDKKRKSEIDSHKNDAVNKAKDGKGHWKHELASSSEAAIKADREETKATDAEIERLQKEAKNMTKK